MRRSDLSPTLLAEARIMIVDDHEPNVQLLEGILRRHGHVHIESVTDPREALRIFSEFRPDLLLLDLHMPHLDGFAVLEQLGPMRNGDSYLPVLVLTADVDPGTRQRALNAGAEDFLTKPFNADEVVARSHNLLETRFLYRELERRNTELAAEVVERSHAASEAATARSAILASLNRLQPGASLERTADAICAEFAQTEPFATVAVVAFDSDGGGTIIGSAGLRRGVPARVLRLEPQLVERLRSRAESGPWVEAAPERMTSLGQAAEAWAALHGRWFCPIRSEGEVLGLLVAGTPADIPTTDAGRHLAVLSEYAAVARALLVPSLAQRTDEASRRRDLMAIVSARAFAAVFQPIVDLRDGTTVGYEALTRFRDGERPDLHFAHADRIGLGLELETATMELALEEARGLPPGCFVSVNVSPAMILGGAALRLLGASDRDVVLEITEHVAIADYGAVCAQVERLGARARLAIDDAGAGFASFRHIIELRPHFVKIDMGLIHGIDADPSRQALVVGMRYFAEKTGASLLAEGVETAAERDALRELGIPYAQGYLFGRPAAVGEAIPQSEGRSSPGNDAAIRPRSSSSTRGS